jgi:signal-transduction protein with cAMP-binding, CBS, and nucleotidyltransferase domain
MIIEGVVSVRKDGVEVRQQWKGASFGALSISGEMVTRRTPTLVCLFDSVVVKLSRADYLRICGSLEESVVEILQKPPDDRAAMDLELVSSQTICRCL